MLRLAYLVNDAILVLYLVNEINETLYAINNFLMTYLYEVFKIIELKDVNKFRRNLNKSQDYTNSVQVFFDLHS